MIGAPLVRATAPVLPIKSDGVMSQQSPPDAGDTVPPYNGIMARGWESKSVEFQIESAETHVHPSSEESISQAELERLRKRESLMLSRTRVLHDLETSQNPRYRSQLEKALFDLNKELTTLDRPVVRAATA
jgi:hypothetical protein